MEEDLIVASGCLLTCIAATAALITYQKELHKRKHKCWVKGQLEKTNLGSYNALLPDLELYDAAMFKNYLRMDRASL